MYKHELVNYLVDNGIIAIIRGDSGVDELVRVVEALAVGGLNCIEVTMNTPGALDCIAKASEKFQGSEVLMGVGTVLDAETCRMAILAGAQYVVSPIVSRPVIEMAHRYGKPVLPGALTPTEIHGAWEMGGDLIKVFPNILGGLSYLKAVRGPLEQIPLVPTGGVTVENLADYVKAGAAAIGVGGGVVSQKQLETRDYVGITVSARRMVDALREARKSVLDS